MCHELKTSCGGRFSGSLVIHMLHERMQAFNYRHATREKGFRRKMCPGTINTCSTPATVGLCTHADTEHAQQDPTHVPQTETAHETKPAPSQTRARAPTAASSQTLRQVHCQRGSQVVPQSKAAPRESASARSGAWLSANRVLTCGTENCHSHAPLCP